MSSESITLFADNERMIQANTGTRRSSIIISSNSTNNDNDSNDDYMYEYYGIELLLKSPP